MNNRKLKENVKKLAALSAIVVVFCTALLAAWSSQPGTWKIEAIGSDSGVMVTSDLGEGKNGFWLVSPAVGPGRSGVLLAEKPPEPRCGGAYC